MSTPGVPALYESTVRHVRAQPVRHAFAYRTYYWLVDLDDLPRPPWPLRALGGFHAADHGGGRAASTRDDIDSYLAAHGVDLAGGRVLMLAHARVLGHVFNPLTVYWCHDRGGRLARVVAEVHNTYGGRHRYLLDVDERGRAEADKEFHVSPFNRVEGRYRLSLPVPGERVALTVALHRRGRAPFVASVRGLHRPATPGALVRLALRYPLAPLVAALRIRRQGIELYLRGLTVHPPRARDRMRTERTDRPR